MANATDFESVDAGSSPATSTNIGAVVQLGYDSRLSLGRRGFESRLSRQIGDINEYKGKVNKGLVFYI